MRSEQPESYPATFDDSDEHEIGQASGCSRRLVVMMLLGFLGLLTCGMGGVLGQLLVTGNSVATRVKDQLTDNAKLEASIGEIKEVNFRLFKTLKDEASDTFVFDIQGQAKDAELVIEYDFKENKIISAKLRDPDGTETQIISAPEPSPAKEPAKG